MNAVNKAPMLALGESLIEDIARTESELRVRRESVTAEAVAAILQRSATEVREVMASSGYVDALERVQHERDSGLDSLAGMSATALRTMILQVQASLDRGEVDPSEIPALSRPLVSILAEFNKLKAKAGEFDHLPMIHVIFDGGIHSEPGPTPKAEVVDVPAVEVVEMEVDKASTEPAADAVQPAEDDGIDIFAMIDFGAEVTRG